VEKAAALRSARENYYTLEDCDHSTVCKPSAKDHPSYSLLLDVIRECRQEGPIKSNTYLGFECNWKENFQFYVEPSNLPNILLQKLVKGLNNILVYGGFGYGKTALVKYVLYKNAKELNTIFNGGIFHMRYGHKDNELLSCQKELIRALHLNPQEVSIQNYFACIPTFYYHECGGRRVMNYLLGYVRHMCVCITNIYKCSSIIQTKLKKG
jgi:hypothetical protein